MEAEFRKSNMLPLQRITRIALALTLLLILNAPAFGKPKEKSIIAKVAKLQKLAGDFKFTEGPACDSRGNIYFTDQPNNLIVKWSIDNKLSAFGSFGRANGMYFDKKGNLITCSDEKNELWAITPDGKATVLVKDYEGKRLNGPNDLWIAPNGGMYITDPFYKCPWWYHLNTGTRWRSCLLSRPLGLLNVSELFQILKNQMALLELRMGNVFILLTLKPIKHGAIP